MQGTGTTNDRSSPSKAAPSHPPPNNQNDGMKAPLWPPSPYHRLAIVAGILLPIATVPYFLSRRRISGLQRKCEELEWKVSVMERRMGFYVSKSGLQAEQEKMRSAIYAETGDIRQAVTREIDDIRQNLTQEIHNVERDMIRRDVIQSETYEGMQADLNVLLKTPKHMRMQSQAIANVGVALGDVAAFMHEVELKMGLEGNAGKDPRGIERVRLIAYGLNNQNVMPRARKQEENPSPQSSCNQPDTTR